MGKSRTTDYRLERLDENRLGLPNTFGIPVRIFANEAVPIERAAVTELIELLELQTTLERMYAGAPELFDVAPSVEAVALSSDFHKGSGIPIGTTLKTRGVAIPQAIGTDVNCGMRVVLTSLTEDQIAGRLPELEQALRHIFFGGGRRIALNARQREAMLAEGLPGLLETNVFPGEDWLHVAEELSRINGGGGARADVPAQFADYVRGSGEGSTFDGQIGSLGGGNHFAEIDVIRNLPDRATAHAWGVKEGQVVVMIHTGSLGFGHTASAIYKDIVRSLLPKGVAEPSNGILPLPLGETCSDAWLKARAAIQTAANFAFANRFYLGRMVLQALNEVVGETEGRLLWDSPHNLLWEESDGNIVHRKGSTPARAADVMIGSEFAWGEPVIVPGSMGAPSYLLRSEGNLEALYSACHGAGRALPRGAAQRGHDAELDTFLERFRIVRPVDPKAIQGRRDLIEAWRQEVKQEAPFAYKAIGPIIETLQNAGVATPVAELHPLVTVKG